MQKHCHQIAFLVGQPSEVDCVSTSVTFDASGPAFPKRIFYSNDPVALLEHVSYVFGAFV